MLSLALAETLALVGGTVHSMKPGEPARVATILIENDRIESVGPDVPIPSDAKRVDVSGMHVVPGLIDGMVNHDPDHDVLYVSAGVTLVRDVGNDLARILLETDRNARERAPGPWIMTSGAVLDGPSPSTTSSIVIASPAEAETKLHALFELEPSVDFVSVRPGLPLAAWTKVIELAHAAHRQVWGPLPNGASLVDARAAKHDGLYHLEAFLPAGKTWTDVAAADWTPLVELAAASGIAVTPTLAVFGERLVPPKQGERELDYLGPFYAESWLGELAQRGKLATKEHLQRGLAAINAQGALVKALHEKGVPLVPGSAAPNPWLFPGDALLNELVMWKRAGLAPAEVLRLATAGAAERLGLEKRGTIERFKVADLVVTQDDPTLALEALKDPRYVVLRGRVLGRAELDAKKAELVARQKEVKARFAEPLPVGEPDLPNGDVILKGRVETRALGSRVSAERYVVVRRFDGALVYSGRMFVPGAATTTDTHTWIQQTIVDGQLDALTLKVQIGPLETAFTTERAGGRMNLVRRDAGMFVENTPINDKLAFVDVGSVTSALILGYQQRKEGTFKVLFLEDLQPAVAPWQFKMDKDDATHLVKTHQGAMTVTFGPLGSPVELWREAGAGRTLTKTLEVEAPDGRGLPTPKDKR